jgi:hypothetical protein
MYNVGRGFLSAALAVLLSACSAAKLMPASSSPGGSATQAESSTTYGSRLDKSNSAARLYVVLSSGQPHSVVQYLHSNQSESGPAAIVRTRGVLFGADKDGNMYSISESDVGCPCRIYVQDVNGRLLYNFAPLAAASDIRYIFVTSSGSVYYSLQDCSKIYQLAQITSNRSPAIVRTIDIPKQACVTYVGKQSFPQFPLFVDRNGGVYFTGSRGSSNSAWYIWAPGAKGNAKPTRVIFGNLQYAGVQGVDSKGNIWSLGRTEQSLTAAWKFPPSANGSSKPMVVPLKGMGGVSNLLVGLNDELAYYGGGSRSTGLPILLNVASSNGSRVLQSITLSSSYAGSTLQGISF